MNKELLKKYIDDLETEYTKIAFLIEVTRDSCRNNEFFAQELTLNLALEYSEKIMDTVGRISNILYRVKEL